MDIFINHINTIKKEIDALKETYIVNHQMKNKQILVYYLYRILCKHYATFELFTPSESILDIKKILNIPHQINNCVPLCQKIPNDLKVLDILFVKIMNLITIVNNNIQENKDLIKKDNVEFLYEFCLEKKEKDDIKMDLVLLSSLLPKLGKISSKPFRNV